MTKAGRTSRPLVAVVEDDESVGRAIKRMLSADGRFIVSLFATGSEFLHALGALTPDCIILDYHTPGMTAPAIQRKLKLQGLSVPVIVISARDDMHSKSLCLAAGAKAYLVKPVVRDQLVASIGAALGRPRSK